MDGEVKEDMELNREVGAVSKAVMANQVAMVNREDTDNLEAMDSQEVTVNKEDMDSQEVGEVNKVVMASKAAMRHRADTDSSQGGAANHNRTNGGQEAKLASGDLGKRTRSCVSQVA